MCAREDATWRRLPRSCHSVKLLQTTTGRNRRGWPWSTSERGDGHAARRRSFLVPGPPATIEIRQKMGGGWGGGGRKYAAIGSSVLLPPDNAKDQDADMSIYHIYFQFIVLMPVLAGASVSSSALHVSEIPPVVHSWVFDVGRPSFEAYCCTCIAVVCSSEVSSR